ncbi:MAG: YfbM family protein [Pseudomonadota bacterium]
MIFAIYSADQQTVERLVANPDSAEKFLEDVPDEDICDIDKSWNALHFLLTGDSWGGPFPGGFIMAGNPIGDGTGWGYGPLRYFSAAQVAEVDDVLRQTTATDLIARSNATAMNEAEIYPEPWNDPIDEGGYLSTNYQKMQRFVAKARSGGRCLLVLLS